MKAIIQDKKQTSRIFQPKMNVCSNHLIDHRPSAAAQTKLINMITSSTPIQRAVLTRSQQAIVDNTVFLNQDDLDNFNMTLGPKYGLSIVEEMISRILSKSGLSMEDSPDWDESDEIYANISYHGDLDEYDDPDEIDRCIGDVTQLSRKGNTPSGPKSYTTKLDNYVDITYVTGPKGDIDFSKPKSYKSGKDPVVTGSLVNLPSTIDKTNRGQHFAIADKLRANQKGWKKASDATKERKGTYTWHHMLTPYNMVLVDMTVHAKHGHNGGVYLW